MPARLATPGNAAKLVAARRPLTHCSSIRRNSAKAKLAGPETTAAQLKYEGETYAGPSGVGLALVAADRAESAAPVLASAIWATNPPRDAPAMMPCGTGAKV